MTQIQVMLTINQKSKSIPYPAASHPNSQNYGFHVLKGKLNKCEKVQEASDNASIINILKILNRNESPFFSVGCEKSYNHDREGYWVKGYVEFAFNYENLVSDAARYFPLFFHFSKYIHEFISRNNVQFWWDLQPANFEKVPCMGFSACIWITTGLFPTALQAKEVWEQSVDMLSAYLEPLGKPEKMKPIYGSSTRQ